MTGGVFPSQGLAAAAATAGFACRSASVAEDKDQKDYNNPLAATAAEVKTTHRLSSFLPSSIVYSSAVFVLQLLLCRA